MAAQRDMRNTMYHLQIQIDRTNEVIAYYQNKKDSKINLSFSTLDSMRNTDTNSPDFRLLEARQNELEREIDNITQIIDRTIQEKERLVQRMEEMERQLDRNY